MILYSPCETLGMTTALIGRITTSPNAVVGARGDHILLTTSDRAEDRHGFAAVMTPEPPPSEWSGPLVYGFRELNYLEDGDVVAVEPRGFVRTLYRRRSPHNSIFMTDQCNSFCLMCSQPPKQVDDRDREAEHLRLIELIDPETKELGITGGEPTLFGDGFLRVVEACKRHLPTTALHVLTNGRAFFYREFAQRLASICHADLVLGIPLYSSVDSVHDYVVQAAGAFEETVLGLHHLAEYGVQIEIRVVVHAQTYRHLPLLAEFIARNFPFACHVAIMGLEMFGFTRPNIARLWVDPFDYQSELAAAVEVLALSGMTVSIYNHQLCLLPPEMWPFAARSISDWKNIYFPECDDCGVRDECGGFFASASWKRSVHVRPVLRPDRRVSEERASTFSGLHS